MNLDIIETTVKKMLQEIGEDPQREGLQRTPQRVAKMLEFLSKGYKENPKDVIGGGIFESPNDEMVVVTNIDFFSLCEHHLLPFFGRAHVAYLPNKRILGLSKIARLVEVFARRLQVQERMTEEIAQTIQEHLKPQGVAVVVEAQHLCMMMRGVQKINSVATTSALYGAFRTQPETRAEFMNHISPR